MLVLLAKVWVPRELILPYMGISGDLLDYVLFSCN